jgi:uncharacterized protein YfaS (alpha-2-macroglobulin family)
MKARTLTLYTILMGSLTGIGFLLAQQGSDKESSASPVLDSASPIVVGREPAKNPTTLSLIVDHRKVLGWISGTGDFTGREVKVSAGGRDFTVTVHAGNSFTWNYEVKEVATATFRIDTMSQSVTLQAQPALEPNAFFVLERSVYRPGQELKFAGFLRKVDERGEFIPFVGQNVSVKIVSDHKQTTATTLQLKSDDMGRVEGVYRWTEGDVMDEYTLSIDGFKGTAKVSLAEYRKSKIKLKVGGKVDEGKLTLSFDAVDFLEKPVPGSKVTFNAQVVQGAGETKDWTLNGEGFAYHSKPHLIVPEQDELTEEESLLLESDIRHLSAISFGNKSIVSQFNQELALDSGSAEFTIDMKREWLQSGFQVEVQAVLLDANGHEQRATHTVPLDEDKPRLTLRLQKRVFATNETITLETGVMDETGVTRKGKSTVVAMRLEPGQVGYAMQQPYWNNLSSFQNVGYLPYGRRSARFYQAPAASSIVRTMVTATGFEGNKAEISIPDAGAYKLVVVTHTGDGKSFTDEIGCVVRDPDEIPRLHLSTNKHEYSAREILEAEIHSRFSDACVFVTLRDSTGVRLWQSMQLTGHAGKLSLRLPEDVRYACDLAIHYAEANGRMHVADQIIRVVPDHRFLTIKTEHKEQVSPGDVVKLKLHVNRAEPVDLVVSVYDQSLLGITADKQADVRNFYFADERITLERDRDLLRRRLGSFTLAALIEQAEALIKEREKSTDPAERQWMAHVSGACHALRNNGSTNATQIASLIEVAGLRVHCMDQGYHYPSERWSKSGATSMADVIENLQEQSDWYLSYRFFNGELVMSSRHVSQADEAFHLQQMYGMNLYSSNLSVFDQRMSGLQFRGVARGDAAFSRMHFATANSSFSAEGQAALSHMAPQAAGFMAPADSSGADVSATIRRDFSDAAFWNARVRTDSNGHATVEFKLPDSLTNWQVVVTAVTRDLHVGTTTSRFRTFKPVMIWPLLPRNFTLGDTVAIFGTVHNHTDKTQIIQATLDVNNGEIVDSPKVVDVEVPAKGNLPVYWRYRPAKTGFTEILMSAKCADGSDASLKRLPVRDASVWETTSKAGFCKGSVKFTVPSGIDLSTARVDVSIAPTLAADMAETLDYLVDYPHGCVEQTMSRFLPAIKVAQILTKFRIKNPGLEGKLPKCVDMGIKRLLELQQADGGWGWNGNSATHEMMTPYALYGLIEAESAGYIIPNGQAVQRGLTRLRGFIDNMGEEQTADRIYCMYVYSHREDMEEKWWTFIEEQSNKGKLSDYASAMALEMAAKNRKKALAGKLAARLRKRAVQDSGTVHWQTAGFSRWGDDRNEITAAVLKAFVACDIKDDMIPQSLAYFAQNKRGNRWNSTKDTAMILYAMCDYLAQQDGSFGGKKVATLQLNQNKSMPTLRLDDGLTGTVSFRADELQSGENILHFQNASPGMMFRLNLRYRQAGNEIKAQANGLEVQREFWLLDPKTGSHRQHLKDGDTVPRGSYIMSRVTVTSRVSDQLRYVLVENPKPGSCEIQPVEDSRFQQHATQHVLREDKETGVFWHHEQTNGNIQNHCVLRCELSGDFVFAPAHVELMYKPETRGHSGTFRLKVVDED